MREQCGEMEAQIFIVSRSTDPIWASGINTDGLGFGLRQGGVAEKMLGEKHGPGKGRETEGCRGIGGGLFRGHLGSSAG